MKKTNDSKPSASKTKIQDANHNAQRSVNSQVLGKMPVAKVPPPPPSNRKESSTSK